MFRELVGSVRKSLGFQFDRKAIPASDPAFSELFGALPTASGVSVTPHTALRVPAVFHAIRLISENAGSIPFKVYRDGSKEAAKDHPAYRLVHNRAADHLSAAQFRTDLTWDALLHGAGFAQVIRTDDGRPYAFRYLPPGTCRREIDDFGEPYFIVTLKDRRQVRLSTRDVLYLPAPGYTSPVNLGREAIGVAMLLERHAAKFFGSGARPSGVLWNENKVPDNDKGSTVVGNMLADYRKAFLGEGDSRPLILQGGWRYQAATMNSTDAQFIENRVEQTREIARLFGVPPTMLFDLSDGTYANTEQMEASFQRVALRPWLDRWQDAYATVLLTEDEQDEFYIEAVIDDLQRADAKAKAEVFSKHRAAGNVTANEVRATMNMPALPGGDVLANPFTTTGDTAGSNDNPDTGKDAA
ncbi:phage portal protein [uncultured Bosea sp.]|uniref:phage portal protein n=1 Tax=uncultured Bosea sp. TaxID=211457 RepID=UPI00263BC91C|nr:phage portal protein [uncultured Bosea sp.]